jgi:hypothetical protein
LNRLKKYFSHLLNINCVNDVRQIEMHTAEPLALDPSSFEDEIVTKLGKHSGLRSINSVILFGSLGAFYHSTTLQKGQ